jgi:hypothetical protein
VRSRQAERAEAVCALWRRLHSLSAAGACPDPLIVGAILRAAGDGGLEAIVSAAVEASDPLCWPPELAGAPGAAGAARALLEHAQSAVAAMRADPAEWLARRCGVPRSQGTMRALALALAHSAMRAERAPVAGTRVSALSGSLIDDPGARGAALLPHERASRDVLWDRATLLKLRNSKMVLAVQARGGGWVCALASALEADLVVLLGRRAGRLRAKLEGRLRAHVLACASAEEMGQLLPKLAAQGVLCAPAGAPAALPCRGARSLLPAGAGGAPDGVPACLLSAPGAGALRDGELRRGLLRRVMATLCSARLGASEAAAKEMHFLSYACRALAGQPPDAAAQALLAGPPQNAVVLVDSRANPLSAAAVLLSCRNCGGAFGRALVFTSREAAGYYRKRLPFAEVVVWPGLASFFHIDSYNRVLKSADFWRRVGGEYALVVQEDGWVARPAERLLRSLMQDGRYDYVGAPWPAWDCRVQAGCGPVGNGGLSLRRVPAMVAVCRVCEREKAGLYDRRLTVVPEDVYFALCVERFGGRVPAADEASEFSTEAIMNARSVGFHKPWPYHPEPAVRAFFEALFEKATDMFVSQNFLQRL